MYEVALDPDAEREIGIVIAPLESDTPPPADQGAAHPATPPETLRHWQKRSEEIWLDRSTTLAASNPIFERVMRRALLDLRVLRSRLYGLDYFAARLPWFATLFGRDAAVVGPQTLPYGWGIVRQTLRLLARLQATADDPYRDAQPGKILHEYRGGELARVDAIPQSPAYYGTVDATPLLLILLTEYVRWSGDLDLARELRPNVEAAAAYNPMSYHLGSVWPHDNAIAVAGFRAYGHDAAALRVFEELFDAAANLRGFRLPELYCGHGCDVSEDRLIGYPVACSPQAWASGALPHALWNVLGLGPQALEARLTIARPRLPRGLDRLELQGLAVGAARVDLRFARQPSGDVGFDAHVREGDLDVREASEMEEAA